MDVGLTALSNGDLIVKFFKFVWANVGSNGSALVSFCIILFDSLIDLSTF